MGKSFALLEERVFFEILTGTKPLALQQQQQRDPMAFLGEARPEIPAGVRAALDRGLAFHRTDRHPSVAHLVAALKASDGPTAVVSPRPPASAPPAAGDRVVTVRRRPRAILLAVGLAIVAGVVALRQPAISEGLGLSFPVDTTRYAVFPFDLDSSVPPLNERALVRDELGGWSGLTLVDEGEEGEMTRNGYHRGTPIREAVRIARRLGAGRVLLGSVSRADDSLRIQAGLYETLGDGRLIRPATRRVSGPGPGVGIALRQLTQELLIPSAAGDPVGTPRTSRVLPARQAFETGRGAIGDWDLTQADSAFARAGRADPGFVEASLWLGLVRQWQRSEPARWRAPAEQAAAGRDRLAPREQRMTDALQAAAQGDGLRACRAWQELTARDGRDYLSWYSSALCQMRDTIVVADQASASGWRFRTSYHSGLQALYRAVRLAPALLRSFRPGSNTDLRRLLLVNANAVRLGRDPLTGSGFVGRPAWHGDSLAVIPYLTRVSQLEDHRRPGAADAALSRQRDALREITLLWSEAYPADESAMEALGVAMDLSGRREARDTLRRALTLGHDPADRLRVATSLVWLELKYAVPDDLAGVRRARRLADSILENLDPKLPGAPLAAATLALLTGKAGRGAALLRQHGVAEALGIEATIAASGPSLLAFAALGGPTDSIRRHATETRRAIGELRLADARQSARQEWLARAATLAFPLQGIPGLDSLPGTDDPLLEAQQAFNRGDSTLASALLEQLLAPKRLIRPSELSLDAVVPETELLLRLGRGSAAEAWVAAPLDAFAGTPTDLFADPAIAGSVGRAMALRVRLAAARGDTAAARRWAAPLRLLWSDADPFLQRDLAGAAQFTGTH